MIAVAGALVPESVWSAGDLDNLETPFSVIESMSGGRVGVFGLDTNNGRIVSYRSDERFAMCSVYKWILVAAVLDQVEHHRLELDQSIKYGSGDLLSYAPITRKQIDKGSMTIRELSRAAIVMSDNTAANLLLSAVGGSRVVTDFIRSCGDSVSRLDRNEPSLNSNIAGDLRDTTTARSMAYLMRSVLYENRLSKASREFIIQCLHDCKTGDDRLRSRLPSDWYVGDKTGSGENGAVNDVLFAIPAGRSPIFMTTFFSGVKADHASVNAAYAEISQFMSRNFS